MKRFEVTIGLLVFGLLYPYPTYADQVILDDLIVDGSACVGINCVNGESFGFDTIRIKEDNLRIRAQDTSRTLSFPTRDWQITFNDSSNGGANKFSIDDIDGGRTPFTIEANAPSHSLYVGNGGRIGFGTSTPVASAHFKFGNTPTVRLEQDGSEGFTPQTWDLAGNEANFFIRDATNGSNLVFRILPRAPANSLYIKDNGNIGFGTASPESSVHVLRTDGSAQLLIEETSSTASARTLLQMENNGSVRLSMVNTAMVAGVGTWNLDVRETGDFVISGVGTGGNELLIEENGDVTIRGSLTTAGNNYPDYVFEPEYDLMPLSELGKYIEAHEHLPGIPTDEDVKQNGGVNMSELQLKLLEKVEELTLYTINQEKRITALQQQLEVLHSASHN